MSKESFILKLIIAEKVLLGLVFASLTVGAASLIGDDMVVFTDQMVSYLNLDLEKTYVQDTVNWCANVTNGTIIGISVGMFILTALNFVEAYGLHKRRRWAEWLTVVATSLFIPFEIYEVIHQQTIFRIGALVINVAIVIFLIRHKELFPKKISIKSVMFLE